MSSTGIRRRTFLQAAAGALSGALSADPNQPLNIVFIYADDLGYGDLGCYGSKIPTPNIDKLAADGVKLTKFYSASPVCSTARAAFLTGKYAVRTGVPSVLMPDSPNGLSSAEQTIPRVLRNRG